jgi:hypothetical protein
MDHTGRKTFVVARLRRKAIEAYLKETGMPEDFFKQHCKIKNIGVIKTTKSV